jgi:hypothetical protein
MTHYHVNHHVGRARAYAGFVQVDGHRITAWAHGERLGDHYRTEAGAKAAITRAHRKWLQQWRGVITP